MKRSHTYRRVAADDALARQLQTVFAAWVEAGVLKGNLDLGQYVYRELRVGT